MITLAVMCPIRDSFNTVVQLVLYFDTEVIGHMFSLYQTTVLRSEDIVLFCHHT